MDLVWNIGYWIFTAIYVYTAIVVLATILMENRNPVKTLGWITIMLLLPIVGIILYIFFGKNFRHKKIMAYKLSYPPLKSDYACPITNFCDDCIPQYLHKLTNLLYINSSAPLCPDNDIKVFATGMTAFDTMFADIEAATDHIHLEFYIIENDDVGNKLHDLLIRKARQGVRVRLIYDYLGGWRLPLLWRKSLRDAGVYVQPFLEANNFFNFLLLNYRNHRKLVVIDGKVAYTGGMNVAERYRRGNRLGNWRDTFVRVQGSAVHALQYSFLVDWSFVDGKLIDDPKYYPDPQHHGHNYMQVVTSGPDTDWRTIMQGVVSAISNAQKQIYIHTPYYMPPEGVMVALETAALSGIDVRIMIPERNDSRLVAAASRSYIESMLRCGIRVYFYQHNFLHSKAIVIDGILSIIGSANMDIRSYEQNFEIATFIYDPATAATLVHNFERDMTSSRELNLNVWRHRPRRKRYMESLARLFSPIL